MSYDALGNVRLHEVMVAQSGLVILGRTLKILRVNEMVLGKNAKETLRFRLTQPALDDGGYAPGT
jgi:hypothetical protein